MKSLWEQLTHYGVSQILPMHMPGHKRKSGFMSGLGKYDITEVTGFDDLHHPEGIIKETMDHAAQIYGSDRSYLLVNGSTCGILSAITAATRPGDKILLARNCHKSALNAVTLHQLKPLWLMPPTVSELGVFGGISPAEVETALQNNDDIAAVLIVSPTYEGIVSDVKAITEIAHRHRVPLIVDAAHGAHFRFGKDFPQDALSCGADLVIESLHKTLPSLTQTAILHLKSELVDARKVEFALQTYQSSSPSFLLLASIIECLRIMEEKGETMMEQYSQHLNLLRKTLSGFGECCLLDKSIEMFDYDKGKIVLGFHGYDGRTLATQLLKKSRIELEMAAPGYIIAMTSVYDTKEDLFRFGAEMNRLRREMPLKGKQTFPQIITELSRQQLHPHETRYAKTELCPVTESCGRIAADTIYLYPPGSPLIAAGEIISENILNTIALCQQYGCTVHGVTENKLRVIK